MKTILHKANTRGHINHEWLDTWHTFSFANYYNEERIQFGKLRVINDDTIMGGGGFGTHPHDNMEIITIVLDGALEHKDSMNNNGIIKANEIQVMSAGTGIFHSEYNHSDTELVQLLQIWVFPNQRNVEPRYDQMSLNFLDRKNTLQQVVSPNLNNKGLWIHQDAWFYRGYFEKGKETSYKLHDSKNGVYCFIIDGEIEMGNYNLQKRDGVGIYDTINFTLSAKADSEVLIIEVPL
ncbi:MAG: pirin family protein [Bacteroidales bacterium]|nr:pirin family protein [Bacteroidales bacterium]